MNSNRILIRNIFILLGSTLSVMQGALITPSLTHIANHFSNIENSEFLSKLIISIPPIFIALFSPLAGILFDKYGRKNIILISTILYALAGSSGFYLDNLYYILIGRVLLGVSIAGLMTGFIIIVGDLFENPSNMNKFIGIQGAVMNLSGVIYLLSGEALVSIGWNVAFIGYLLSLVAFIGLYFYLPDIANKGVSGISKEKDKSIFSSNFIKIHFLAVIIMICYLMVPTQIPFIIKYTEAIQNQKPGIYLAFWILISTFSSILYARYIKKYNFKPAYKFSFITWGIGFIAVFFANNIPILLLSLMLCGFGIGIAIPNLKAHLLSLCDDNSRAKQSGYLSTALYIGQFLSPLLIEPIIKLSSPSLPFVLVGIAMLVLAIFGFKINNEIKTVDSK